MKLKKIKERFDIGTIQAEENDENVIKQLKLNNKPILIYGCANHAKLVQEFLEKNDLKVSGFIVDSQYYKNDFYINSIEVKDFAEYLEDIELYDIVIGFCDVIKTKLLIENSCLLKGNFYLLWEPYRMYEWEETYLEKNWKDLQIIYDHLGDDLSKEILDELINAKLGGNGRKLLNLADNRQYFNELTFCTNSKNEIYIDCGAFNGDTICKYVNFSNGSYQKIYAFEPDLKNVLELENNVRHFSNIEIIKKGTWKSDDILRFEEKGSASQISEDKGKESVWVTTIDKVVGKDRVTFIKMDVEGSELESLQGAEETIRNNMPKLAICCYHKKNDIINLYHYISKFNNQQLEYRFYLRHHSNSVYETVLYAIPVTKGIKKDKK